MNAQKKRIDVWLIYRCAACDATWNHVVVERRPVRAIRVADLEAYREDERDRAVQHAFDLPALRLHSERLEGCGQIDVRRALAEPASHEPLRGDTVRLALAAPCDIRLDRLLSARLDLSRTTLHRRFDDGTLRIWCEGESGSRAPLRRPIRDGMHVCFVGSSEILPAPSLSPA